MNGLRAYILSPQFVNAEHPRDRTGQAVDPRQVLRPRRAAKQEAGILTEEAQAVVGDNRCHDDGGYWGRPEANPTG